MKLAPVAVVSFMVGFAAVLLLMAVRAPTAQATEPYCGHQYRQYVRDIPNLGPTVFRIVYRWGSGISNHTHAYRIVRYRAVTNSWVNVKALERRCPDRHPV